MKQPKSFRIDENVYLNALKTCKENNISLAALIQQLLQDISEEKLCPICGGKLKENK